MIQYKIYKNTEYDVWLETQTLKSKRQILDRLLKIEEYGHFGHIRDLNVNGDGLRELKFNDGRRIYFVIIPVDNVILLL